MGVRQGAGRAGAQPLASIRLLSPGSAVSGAGGPVASGSNALGVVLTDQQHQPWKGAGVGVLEHLQVAVLSPGSWTMRADIPPAC
jgi:hypothetical protein